MSSTGVPFSTSSSSSFRSSSSFVLCQVHRRGPVIMNDAICVRDITREPLAAATCISGSRCVTRLIKIPRDLLRRGIAAPRREDEGDEGGREGAGGEKGKEREITRRRVRTNVDTRGRGARRWSEGESGATHSLAVALSSAHVV